MILGILSDTHDQTRRTMEALRILHDAGAEALIHCGDLTSTEILALCSGQPMYFVFGNNDWEIELKTASQGMPNVTCVGYQGIVELAGKRIGVAHGHLRRDVQDLLAKSPDYLLTGHSHAALDERQGPIRRINPGALHRARQFTVAVLDLVTDDLRFLPVT
jgi:putative phosphoesterase